MMKILIDNEEVVSNSNLQIKEEMLSTSSTILKNCYPATWEEDKDYTSRYYFPKDYSKCKIIDETYYPEIIGTRVSGTSLNITYDSNLNWDFEQVQGNTQQTGTPTPDSPVPIQTVTGRQVVSVCGKNIVNSLNNVSYINCSLNNDILTSSSLTSTGYGGGMSCTFTNPVSINLNGTIYISADVRLVSGTTTRLNLIADKLLPRTNGAWVLKPNISNTFQRYCYKFDVSAGNSFTGFFLQLYNCENAVVEAKNVMFSYSSDTTYEQYTGQQYEINLGKNLLPNTATTQTINGITYTINEDKTITANGTATAHSVLNIYNTSLVLQPGTYMFSGCPKNGSWGTYSMGYGTKNDSGNGALIDTTEVFIGVPYIRIASGTTVNNLVFKPMIEKGSSATSYSPYFTPIELNKIGTYQDSIKRSTGKNLFDKNGQITLGARLSTNGTEYYSDASNYYISDWIKIQSNTTYTKNSPTADAYHRVCFYTSNSANDFINYSENNTFTTPATAVYLRFCGLQTELNTTQLEEGSQATSYEPFLPKGTWYIEKKTGSVVLNGTENWGYSSSNAVFYTDKWGDRLANSNDMYCNYFNLVPTNTSYANMVNGNFRRDTGTQARTIFKNTAYTSASSFKTWLSSHNTIVKYILASPTYTEITNEELLGQLNAIENASLFDGTNNIIVSSANLPGAIQIYYNYQHEHTTQDLLFCGCVKNTGNISLNPREPHYVDLQVLDFKDLLSTGETLDFVINNKTITQAITQVVDAISDYGFVVGDVKVLSPNDIINAYSTLNKTPYDVFQYIADITQSRWTTRVIDENTIAIDFYDPSLMPEAQPIEDTEEYYCNNEIDSITFNYSTNDYRNKQIMTSDEVYSNITQTETIIADGYRDSFICQNKIGVIANIKVNGIDSTFTTKTEYEMGISADFIYTPGEMTFTANQIYPAGTIISIEYYAIVKGREIVLNTSEITRVEDQIGRKGIISRYENRNDTTSSQELIKIGQSYIKYKGNAEITLRIVTQKELFNVGQIVSYNAPLEDLSTDYMVKSKTIDMYINAGEIFYIYELSNNFNSENAINYFDNQRAKNQGNLDANETITRNIDIEATALIQFYDYTIEEVQVGTNTTLDFALDSVVI